MTICPAVTSINSLERWALPRLVLDHIQTACAGDINSHQHMSCTLNHELKEDFNEVFPVFLSITKRKKSPIKNRWSFLVS